MRVYLTEYTINREAMLCARKMPRSDEDGLFSIMLVMEFPKEYLALSLSDFSAKVIVPGIEAAWDEQNGGYPDSPMVAPAHSPNYIDWCGDITSRTICMYLGETCNLRIDMRVGEEPATH